MDETQRSRLASDVRERLFAGQEAVTGPLTLHEATARAIKYQTEYRVKLMEEAAALGQLDVANFDLLPKLMVNAGYTTRNNDAFGFGFSPNGAVATNPSASVERTRSTASIGFAWSALDFGVSYYRAKQLADQRLIAEERRRKAVQNLVQDVRLAWWRAEAAQRLLPMIDALFDEVDESIEKTRVLDSSKLLPPLQTASLRRALLDLAQQISLRRIELTQAQLELAALMNLPPGTAGQIAPTPPASLLELDMVADVQALETIALRNRPELAEEAYKARVNESEAKKALLGLFPGLTLDLTRNYDSNRFLLNNSWTSAGVATAFNLVKVFSLPAVNRSAEAQRQVDDARKLAMAMAILTQTRIAAVRYGLVNDEFRVWEEATRDDEQIVKFLSSSAQAGIDTELELIRAKARFLVSKINRDLMYANLEAAMGRVYHSVGVDPLPAEAAATDTASLAALLQRNIEDWKKETFAPRTASTRLPVSIGAIDGVPQAQHKEFRAALERVLGVSRVDVVAEHMAGLRIDAGVQLDSAQSGAQPAVVSVRLSDAKSGALRFSSEFKTTLSLPVDDEQWRTLGEGAAYRVVGSINRMQAGRSLRRPAPIAAAVELRFTGVLSEDRQAVKQAPVGVEQGPLALRLDTGLGRRAQPEPRVAD
jgi:outer membrane protein TolC